MSVNKLVTFSLTTRESRVGKKVFKYTIERHAFNIATKTINWKWYLTRYSSATLRQPLVCKAECRVYVNRPMAFCIGEILKCFVNCSTCITACPIDRIIKPYAARTTTYTTFLQPCIDRKAVFPLSAAAGRVGRGTRCVWRNAPRARSCGGENARDVGSPMIDREIKCKAELTKSDLACGLRTPPTGRWPIRNEFSLIISQLKLWKRAKRNLTDENEQDKRLPCENYICSLTLKFLRASDFVILTATTY